MRALLGISSYNVRVTADELWRRVGRFLADKRGGDNWTHVATRAGIDPKLVKATELGRPKTVRALQLHAEAFKMSIVDIISSVLKETEQPPSPEALTLLRCFEALPVPDRQLLLSSALRAMEQYEHRQRLEKQVSALASSPEPKPDPRSKGPQKK